MSVLTDKQAYIAVHAFLNNFWQLRKAQYDNDLPGLLGDMSLLEDEMPADRAQWSYWKDCAPQETLSEMEAFEAMRTFLENYRQRGEMEERDITRVLDVIDTSPETAQPDWLVAVQRCLAGNYDPYLRFWPDQNE